MVLAVGLAAGWKQGGRALLGPLVRRRGGILGATTIIPGEEVSAVEGKVDVAGFESAKAVGEDLRASGSVRMRFAPSPTGSLHVGGARTALYNWLAARKAGGQFLIRIEDTDLARSTRESEESMLADLEWLGLDWDEGPRVSGPAERYRQSERSDLYVTAAKALVSSGRAYPCFCSEEELEAKRRAAQAAGQQVAYDGTWRDADPEEVRRRIEAGEPHTIRFRAPVGAVVAIDDLIRGRVEWDVQATIGDFILLRSSGVPVYNFCVAVDDALMGISTVVRAEEHLTNTVRQLLVLEALGFEPPGYAHASLILGSDRSKLSKRHGATSCGQFRERGYLPDAMINYLALLGWNDGTDQEVYTRDELVEAFDLSRVVPSPAMFDDQKLRWLNGQHLRKMPVDDLAFVAADHFRDRLDLETPDLDFVRAATKMAQPKADLVSDIVDLSLDALQYPLVNTLAREDDAKLAAVLDDGFADFATTLCRSYDRGEAPAVCYADGVDNNTTFAKWIKSLGEATDRKKKRLFMPVRLALTGRLEGPDVADQLETLRAAVRAEVPSPKLAPIECRIAQLRKWATASASDASLASDDGIPSSRHRAPQAVAPPLTFEDFQKLRHVYEAHRRDLCEDERAMYDVLVAAYASVRRSS
ncbi:hypothetical protein CTAYLR_010787 [Chrysophaeum taylorii]|uniref:glutamate--tRNA ligase n=1 Tax=Chrysophaeum taylorii TaxID=2483200 RepID=A0AAD7UHE3_9STRA|nr:hypothetical protein CTAYLR_010787 [Chrysophaeum taylorii]